MDQELDALRSEVASLRSELDDRRRRSVTRRRLLTGLAGVTAASAAGVVRATPASAADDDPVLLGNDNEATETTQIVTTHEDGTSRIEVGAGNWGLYATADTVAVLGSVPFGGVAGVWGEVAGPAGSGVTGNAANAGAIGVIATSEAGPALAALSRQDGVTLELTPAERSGPPSDLPTGLLEYRVGALSVDENSEVWLCTATGDPGTWTRLMREDTAVGRVIPITPIRVLDTRETGGKPSGSPAVPGQIKGPLRGGQVVTLDLAGIAPIPTTASGVLGNLTAVTPSYTGYVRVAPSGQPFTATALSFTKDGVTGNAFTAKLGPDGASFRASGTTANTYELVVDITAYIT
jgi:hypothetical protein